MDDQPKQKTQPEIRDFQEPGKLWARTPVEGFKYAIDGILDVFRTQKHMRFHFVTMVLVLLVALLFDLSKRDILILVFVVALVLISEMFNTAIEAVVDMVVQSYHPLAKFAKDAAAGAVLIATATAVLVGFMLSVGDTKSLSGTMTELRPESQGSLLKVILTGIVLLVVVTMAKILGTKGKLLKGGVVSGHTAFGFFMASTILFVSKNTVAAILGILMALLIAQSRVEAKIHSLQEVIIGAIVAMLLSAVVYWFPGLWSSISHLIPILGGVFILGY